MCEFSKILITRTRSVHMEFTTVVLCGLRTCFQRHFVIVSRSFTRGTGGAYFPGEKRIQTTKTSFLKKNVFLHPLTAQNCVPKTCMPALHLSGERQEGLPCNLGKGQKKRSLRNSFEIIFAGFSFIFLHAQKKRENWHHHRPPKQGQCPFPFPPPLGFLAEGSTGTGNQGSPWAPRPVPRLLPQGTVGGSEETEGGGSKGGHRSDQLGEGSKAGESGGQ